MKTKIFISALFFLALSYSSFAQKANDYKWGLSIAINDAHSQVAFLGTAGLGLDAEGNVVLAGEKTNASFSLSVIPKYFINEDWLIRFEYGITQIDLKNFYTINSYTAPFPPTLYQINYDTVKQKINRYVAGVQFNFFKNKKIESYGGVNFPYIKYYQISRNSYSETRNATTDTLTSKTINFRNIPGGYAAGLGVFAGFNVYVFKYLSLGAEFSSAIMYYKVGGESIQISYFQAPPNAPLETTTVIYNESYKGIRFTKILASFNLTLWL